jgi:DNA repair exonuclease SbcCD ATPase subunit
MSTGHTNKFFLKGIDSKYITVTRSLDHSAQRVCPLCSKGLEESEYQDVIKQLEKRVLQQQNEQSRKAKRAQKTDQRKRLAAITRRYQNERKLLQTKIKEQTKKSKENFDRELERVKKNYQSQLENIREVYHNQNMTMQVELRKSFDSQLEEIRGNYDSSTANNRNQLEMLQIWLKDELGNVLRDNAKHFDRMGIGEAESSAKIQVTKLAEQLNERDHEMELLRKQIRQLENITPEDQQRLGRDVEDDVQEQDVQGEGLDKQIEGLVNVVKELAHNQQELRDTEEEVVEASNTHSADDSDIHSEPNQVSWGSKMAKRLRFP